jgi:cysteine desulfurase
MKHPIYLDNAATTPVDPRVVQKMLTCLDVNGEFGNPASSNHAWGQAAKQLVDWSRDSVANVIGASPEEIVWTSGATEANNLALKGAAQLYQRKGKHIVTLKTEHKAVLDTCQHLEKNGFTVTYLSPEPNGLLDLAKLEQALRADTIIVSVMHINNELGVIQDIQAIAQLTAERGILLHVDAAQSIGKIPLNMRDMPVDLLSMSAHKIYGPKGVGALYVRKKPRVRVAAQIHGGGQEQGMRSGTLPTHQLVGMAEALNLADAEMQAHWQHVTSLRNRLLKGWETKAKIIHCDGAYCYPGILNLSFAEWTAQDFMQHFPLLAVAAGSACNAKGTEPSYVLRALGLSTEAAHKALRFSVGRFNTLEEMDAVIKALV